MYAIELNSQLKLINLRIYENQKLHLKLFEANVRMRKLSWIRKKAIFFFKKYDLLHFDEIVTV